MARVIAPAVFAAAWFLASGAAWADEVLVGGFAHDVDLGVSSHGVEGGAQVEVGYRTAPFDALRAIGRPMAYGSYFGNTAGRTSYGAIGFQWRRSFLNDRLYGQIGLGGAYHDQDVEHQNPYAPGLSPAEQARRLYISENFKALGTRFLFNPNLALGVRISQRWAVEAVWSHISNAGTGRINPGMDDVGGRIVFRFGPMRR
jgi:hypothetical protein